jgi:PAS domain S-box-containing protein
MRSRTGYTARVTDVQQLLQTAVDQLPAVLWTTDKSLRLTSVMGAALAPLGLDPAQIVGRTAFEVLGTVDETIAPFVASRAALRGESTPFTYTWQGRSFEGRVRPLLSYAGEIIGVVGAALDVTERASLESKLRQSQKMDAVGRLAGGMAHEFNNLLTIILGYCEILLGMGRLDKTGRQQVEEIKLAAEQGAVIARRLLSFSQSQPAQRQPINLNRAVAGMDRMLRRLIGEDIDLISVQDLKLESVLADPSEIEQILMNLASNARDAMPKGGRLTIEAKNATLARAEGPVPAGRYVVLTVTDTGRGMDAETQKRAFEPFFTTKADGEGSGLGLVTVERIVRECGGLVALTSAPGQGTTVRIYFPSLGEAPPPAGRDRRCSEVILLVEDQSRVRELTRLALASIGYTILEASDGAEALRVAERHRGGIDLLVTDVVMPEMSGPDLRAKLGEARPKMRVLFVSGHADRTKYGDLRPFLQKPYTTDVLAARVREILDA